MTSLTLLTVLSTTLYPFTVLKLALTHFSRKIPLSRGTRRLKKLQTKLFWCVPYRLVRPSGSTASFGNRMCQVRFYLQLPSVNMTLRALKKTVDDVQQQVGDLKQQVGDLKQRLTYYEDDEDNEGGRKRRKA